MESVTEECANCLKKTALCVCDSISKIENKYEVLFLQHPQEPDKDLGTAWIAHSCLANSQFKIGLSWPNLAKALGRKEVDSKRWLVLYLGSAKLTEALQFLDKKSQPISRPKIDIQGIVVLDGTWSQAKTLWWRNSWLLKLQRIAIKPKRRSFYGKLRREPRDESVSTIEAVAFVLSELEGRAEISEGLIGVFRVLLERYKGGRVRG